MQKIAIIGSRTFNDLAAVRGFVYALPRTSIIVSGGAIGVDTAAEDAARTCRLSRVIFEPAVERHATRQQYVAALFDRNRRIVEFADRVVAFWDQTSSGTGHAISYAQKLEKPVEIRRPTKNAITTRIDCFACDAKRTCSIVDGEGFEAGTLVWRCSACNYTSSINRPRKQRP